MFKKFKEWFKKNKRYVFTFILVFIVIRIVAVSIEDYNISKVPEVSYTEFLELVEKGEVDTVFYSTDNEYMKFTVFTEETKDLSLDERKDYKYKTEDYFRVLYPSYDEFRKDLLESDVVVRLDSNSTLVDLISTIISLGLPCLWIYFLYKMISGGMKNLDKDSLLQISDVSFDDVIGHDEILDDIKFITELIKNPDMGNDIGAKVPKGILLSGEPGTGKTLIAKAIAGEAGVPFLYMNASSFVEMYVGLGAKRVRELFTIAREHKPCIIFIDEIDAVGTKRNSRGSNSENDQTINALLQEMDGFSERDGIFVIAATNRPDSLDKALTRAGRFDRQISVNPPKDWRVRKKLFEHYLSKFKLGDDIDIEVLSKQVVGFTGADIAMICNEASIIAMMYEKSYIDNACIEEAIDKKIFKGNRSKEETYKNDKSIVAYHEAGHAIETYLVGQPIARASIQATTSGVGGVVFRAETDSCFTTDREMIDNIKIAFAGRASEQIKFEVVTTGASSDISQATQTMLLYIERYGFDKDFGMLDMRILKEENIIENGAIVERLSSMSRKVYEETLSELRNNYHLVEKLAQKLLDVETMSGSEIKAFLEE